MTARIRWWCGISASVLIAALLPCQAADNDADGLPDDWQAQHGFSTNGLPNANLDLSALVGWWQFDASQTNVLDRSTNNLTGTLINFPPNPFVTGLFSNALAFTTNSYVSFGNGNSVLSLTNGFTISVWFLGSNTTEETTLVEWNDVQTNAWEFGVTTNGLAQLRFVDAALSVQTVGGEGATNVRDDQWHHLAGVYDVGSSNAILYVDSRIEASAVITNWNTASVDAFGLGIISIPPPNAPFVLDEVRLYNVALSSNDVAQLPATYDDPDHDGSSNLAEYLSGTDPLNPDTDGDGILDGSDPYPLDYYNGVLPALTIVSGNNQIGQTNTFLSRPLVVRVADGNQNALGNAPVTFTVTLSNGKLAASTNGVPSASSLPVRSAPNGSASAFLYLSSTVGTNLVTVTATSGTNSVSVTFTAIAGSAPPIPTSGLKLWLRADDGVATNGQGQVSTWLDQSGAGGDASQSSSGAQPQWIETVLNSKPVVRFDGTSSFLQTAYTHLSHGLTYVAVLQTTNRDSTAGYAGNAANNLIGDNTGAVYVGFGVNGGVAQYNHYGAGWQQVNGAGSLINGQAYLVIVTHDSASGTVDLYVDGVLQSIGTISYTTAYAAFNRIGGGYLNGSGTGDLFDGDVAEVLVYDRVLSTTERQGVEQLLTEKYALPPPPSPPAEPLPTEGLKLWLRADAGVSTDGQGHVSTWLDQSDAGVDASQSNSGAQPQRIDNVLNAKPVIRFNGTSSFLQTAYTRLSHGLTYVAMLQTTNTYSSAGYEGNAANNLIGDNTGAVYVGFGVNGGVAQYNHYVAGWEQVNGTGTLTNGQAHLVMVTHDSASGSVSLYVDGVLQSTATIAYTTAYAAFNRIGGGYVNGSATGDLFDGDVAEVLVYDRVLSTTERHKVEQVLGEKYLSPPATGMTLWLRADGGVTTNSQGQVSTWLDQSDAGVDASQSSSGAQPEWIDNVVNSKPVVHFNGTSSFLQTAYTYLSHGLTYVAVLQTTNADSSAGYEGNAANNLIGDNTGGVSVGFGVNAGVAQYNYYDYSGAGWTPLNGTGTLTNGQAHLVIVTHDSTSGLVSVSVDGGVPSIATIAYTTAYTAFNRIGGGYVNGSATGDLFDGDVAEVFVYDRALSTGESQDVEQLLRLKYALPPPPPPPTGTNSIPMTGLKLWLRADAGVTTNSQGQVSTWQDQSGAHLDASQSSSGAQPQRIDNALNSKPVVRFNGTSSFLQTAYTHLSHGLTYVAVLQTTNTDSSAGYAGNAANNLIGDNTGAVYLGFGVNAGVAQYNHYGAGWQQVNGTGTLTNGQAHLVIVTHDSTSGTVNLYVDGTLQNYD